MHVFWIMQFNQSYLSNFNPTNLNLVWSTWIQFELKKNKDVKIELSWVWVNCFLIRLGLN